MAILKMEGRTYDMLKRDKRVYAIRFARYGDVQGVQITLANGWLSDGCFAGDFPDWEAARNWVRKAINLSGKTK